MDEPVVLYSHDDQRNLGHTTNDFLNSWLITQMAGWGNRSRVRGFCWVTRRYILHHGCNILSIRTDDTINGKIGLNRRMRGRYNTSVKALGVGLDDSLVTGRGEGTSRCCQTLHLVLFGVCGL